MLFKGISGPCGVAHRFPVIAHSCDILITAVDSFWLPRSVPLPLMSLHQWHAVCCRDERRDVPPPRSVNKCNCLLLCACPGDLASHFNANSIALCFNDRLHAISKPYEGTVGSVWETNESSLFFDGFVFFFTIFLTWQSHYEGVNFNISLRD